MPKQTQEPKPIPIRWDGRGARVLRRADGLTQTYRWEGTGAVVEVAREDALAVLTAEGPLACVNPEDRAALEAEARAPAPKPEPPKLKVVTPEPEEEKKDDDAKPKASDDSKGANPLPFTPKAEEDEDGSDPPKRGRRSRSKKS